MLATALTLCPDPLQAFYEAAHNGPVSVVPLAPHVSDIQCPYPKPSGGDMDLPSWIYSPQTGKCYYKSSFAKGITNNINDATRRCTVRAPAGQGWLPLCVRSFTHWYTCSY